MYILQNAFQNVLRNRGRNILIGIIVFAIITTSVIALIINNTASGIIEDYKGRFGSEVTISPNLSQLQSSRTGGGMGGGSFQTAARIDFEQITPQQYLDFANSEYLLYTQMTASQMVSSGELDAYGSENDSTAGLRIAGAEGSSFTMPEFRLLGNQFDDFEEGTREVTYGRMVEGDNECLVSEELAEKNGLSVGDVITLTGTSLGAMRMTYQRGASNGEDEASGDESETEEEEPSVIYTLTVVGFYYDATEEDAAGGFSLSLMNRRNELLTTFDTLATPLKESETGATVSATYYLKDPADLSAFEAEVRAKGLSGDYIVSTDEAGYDTVVKPIAGMKSITLTFLVIVLILGAVILLLLSSIAIRERKYEIGVLRAMGMKKRNVALGLWSEMLIITGICVVLGLIAGTIAAQPVSDTLLSAQLESINNASAGGMGGGAFMVRAGMALGGGGYSALDSLDVSLGLGTFFEIIGIALLMATAAALAAVTKITKYEPIKILMERN